MADETSSVCLRELCDRERGITYGIVQPGDHVPKGIPILRADDVKDGRINISNLLQVSSHIEKNYSRSRLRGGEVLLTLVGAYFGKSAVTTGDHIGLNTARAVGVIPALEDPHYISYALRSQNCQAFINERATTTAQPTLNLRDVAEIPIPWPSASVRKRVTEMLRTLDDKIELNRRMNETLEAMARAIFKDWFVDFGPTRAKAEGRAPYVAPEIWSLFPDRLDDEDKPEGWEWGTVAQIGMLAKETVNPLNSPNTVFDLHSLPAFDAGQCPAQDYGTDIRSNKTVVPVGSVLLSKLNPEIPRVWVTDVSPDRPAISSTEFLVFQPIAPAGQEFLFALFYDDRFRERLRGMVTGTSNSHQRVSPKGVLDIELALPREELFEKFSLITAPLLDRVGGNRREVKTLAALRDLLLPKLMSGEIRVRDAEKAVGEAA